MSEKEIKIFNSIEDLNEFAAHEFVRICAESIAKRGRFAVALSGGSSPKKLNALLASDAFREKIEWRKVQFFFGDERSVLPDSEESNFRMANETLFSKLKIPKKNIHRFPTEKYDAIRYWKEGESGCGFGFFVEAEKNFAKVAAKMEGEIKSFFELKEHKFPRFDLIFLGMGDDGHTASLFPETEALKEKEKIVTENFVPKFETFRLTFTYPAINNARNIIFLVVGADKAEAAREVLEGKYNPQKFPSQKIKPADGKLLFLFDEKAARLISINK